MASTRVSAILREALDSNILHGVATEISNPDSDSNHFGVECYNPAALFYDLDLWEKNVQDLTNAFKEGNFLHACAIKTNPLSWFLKKEKSLNCGAECASISEVQHALENGFKPGSVVFDSPCKTLPELEFALNAGIHLNIDNYQELERVDALVSKMNANLKGTIGVRINPLVGAGKIAALSVSTGKSKFGIPCPAEGDERNKLITEILKRDWITGLHVHTGSGGYGLKQLCHGVRVAVDLCLELNKLSGKKKISILDIGGGLSVNYKSNEISPTFYEYSAELQRVTPELFDKNMFDYVITEFGAALHAKFAWFASRVEYTKSYDGGRIALIHAGSDLFLRACYCPGTFVNHRIFAYNEDGTELEASESRPNLPHDIAGPLCFAGDVVAHDVKLPELVPNDIIVIADAGANSFSLKTTHCSRPAPPVYGYTTDNDGKISFVTLKQKQEIKNVLGLWES
eukprot:CAMPEP_0184009072 /NCGR_PEP_ID=MMETSP0954-20121128/2376_1 /TAXON_ID=627963 /ORGANISM="Aplanochytrium sp, Strain PBS07" /LENGTH=456 /DNA_ID=CAMNT_0026288353 /DNA_START=50 /DNA_END=1420 /DNA_ORIENTATION=-